MRITYYAAISRDGLIAREDGDVSWLDEIPMDPAESDYDSFFDSVDGLLMGRNTYDFVFDYGSWPYGEKVTWVCTGRPLVGMSGANLSIVSDPEMMIRQAREKGFQHLWLVGGGQLASALLVKGWVTDLQLTEFSVELGAGIPLFSDHDWKRLPVIEKTEVPRAGYRRWHIKLAVSGG